MKKLKGNFGYYSHSKRIYNTEEEKAFLKAINKKFKGTVICPNNHIGKLTNNEDYLSIVRKADIVFVSNIEGYIGKGSYKECNTAMENGIPVYLVERNGKDFYFRYAISLEVDNPDNPIKYAAVESVLLD
ncbi:hypothetical protein [Lutibacter sp.]|uniref:hypothetical protein n=1 Tax=Lutibacter sp. TaxID=1925666 RepID=UPI0025C470DD|nr:hypothetical protein [Lutibacter sp.]MCF6180501.1 hypothetical protein [Lutibacter sp.]